MLSGLPSGKMVSRIASGLRTLSHRHGPWHPLHALTTGTPCKTLVTLGMLIRR